MSRFLRWLEERGVTELDQVEPLLVAAYIEQLGRELSKPSVKQHLAGEPETPHCDTQDRMKHEDENHTRPDARGVEEALALFPLGLELTRARLRREDPEASPELIEERLSAWLDEIDSHSRPASRNGK